MIHHKLIRLSKVNLFLIQSIEYEKKHLNDFDLPQNTIKWDIFVDSHFVWAHESFLKCDMSNNVDFSFN